MDLALEGSVHSGRNLVGAAPSPELARADCAVDLLQLHQLHDAVPAEVFKGNIFYNTMAMYTGRALSIIIGY